MTFGHIHLIEGPVGAGKSTYAGKLGTEHGAPRLILDDWMTTLFRPDRPAVDVMPWYIARKARCIDQIWKVASGIVSTGANVVLELGLIRYEDRLPMYTRLEDAGFAFTLHVLEAPRDVRRARVMKRNAEKGETFAMEVPLAFFELASDMWERPDDSECNGRDVRFVAT